jgi:hypothetical protein
MFIVGTKIIRSLNTKIKKLCVLFVTSVVERHFFYLAQVADITSSPPTSQVLRVIKVIRVIIKVIRVITVKSQNYNIFFYFC